MERYAILRHNLGQAQMMLLQAALHEPIQKKHLLSETWGQVHGSDNLPVECYYSRELLLFQ